MQYTREFEEVMTLRGGGCVHVRLVRAEDKDEFERALARANPDSIYRRFLTQKDRFTKSELEYLTEVDEWNHLALVAGLEREGRLDGVGVARFVRFLTRPDTADFALFVMDEVQGQGLGKALFFHLTRAAKERGVKFFSGEMLASNTAMFHLVDTCAPDAEWLLDGPMLHVMVNLETV